MLTLRQDEALLIISESVYLDSGKCWGDMLSRHVLGLHGGLEKENIALKTPTKADLTPMFVVMSAGTDTRSLTL